MYVLIVIIFSFYACYVISNCDILCLLVGGCRRRSLGDASLHDPVYARVSLWTGSSPTIQECMLDHPITVVLNVFDTLKNNGLKVYKFMSIQTQEDHISHI